MGQRQILNRTLKDLPDLAPLGACPRLSSQNDNVRFDQSRNVLLRMFTLLPFRKGEQGGKRGSTDDETA